MYACFFSFKKINSFRAKSWGFSCVQLLYYMYPQYWLYKHKRNNKIDELQMSSYLFYNLVVWLCKFGHRLPRKHIFIYKWWGGEMTKNMREFLVLCCKCLNVFIWSLNSHVSYHVFFPLHHPAVSLGLCHSGQQLYYVVVLTFDLRFWSAELGHHLNESIDYMYVCCLPSMQINLHKL